MAQSPSTENLTFPKRISFYLLSIFLGLALPLLVFESVLRFLPVREALTSIPVDKDNPVFRFPARRDFLWSRDWNFSIQTTKHSNNYGFLNDQDYITDAEGPLLAVIGDSFVEASQVGNDRTLTGLLSKEVGQKGRVYSFASSGAALSQYLAYADFARNEFHPAAMMFVIIGNDFDESLMKYKHSPGHHYFSETDGGLTLTRLDYHPSRFRELLKSSALVRYLYYNCELRRESLTRVLRGKSGEDLLKVYVGNTASRAGPERLSDSRRAVEAFFQQLPERSGLPSENILFVIDGMRPHLYSDEGLKLAEGSYFDLMRKHFMNAAKTRGYEVIDLQPLFRARHKQDGSRFEFPTDNHWNIPGHEQVARAVASSQVFSRTFQIKPLASP